MKASYVLSQDGTFPHTITQRVVRLRRTTAQNNSSKQQLRTISLNNSAERTTEKRRLL